MAQYPLSGAFKAKTAPTQKKRQHCAMLVARGISENGSKAAALHAPLTGKEHFVKVSGNSTMSTRTAPTDP